LYGHLGPGKGLRKRKRARLADTATHTSDYQPALLGMRSNQAQANQPNPWGAPAESYPRLANQGGGKAISNREVRDATGCNCRHRVHEVIQAGLLCHVLNGKVALVHEVEGKPGQHEIEVVGTAKLPGATTPERSLPKNVDEVLSYIEDWPRRLATRHPFYPGR